MQKYSESACSNTPHSVFKWKDGKHRRTFVHLPNNLLMLACNNSCNAHASFWSVLQDVDANKLSHAFASKDKTEEHQEPEEMIDFIDHLRDALNWSEGYQDLNMFMKHDENMNNPPLCAMDSCTRERKILNAS